MDDERVINKQRYSIVGEIIEPNQHDLSPMELDLLEEKLAGYAGADYSDDAHVFLNAGLTPVIIKINEEFKMTSLEFINGDMN